MIENSKKKGFTLIELLIVIGIIMMISSIGVNGYISYRRESMLFFAVDSAVAQIKELRDKTIHGEDEALCYGIYFKKDNVEDAKYTAEIFKEKYVGKKVWNAIDRIWEYKGCSEDMTDFSLAEEKTGILKL
ncbi:MAG: prepilin-type N-terminal cleavage/methylation domain-containing protein, partial [Candidatus Gracilibacteria bacterium]